MPEVYVPQDGIPVPPVDYSPRTKSKYPFANMVVGQMIFVPGRTGKNLPSYVSRRTRNLPGKFITRHCWMRRRHTGSKWSWVECDPKTDGATEGTGIWRVE